MTYSLADLMTLVAWVALTIAVRHYMCLVAAVAALAAAWWEETRR